VDDVREALATGQIIEEYPEDVPYPSRLQVERRAGPLREAFPFDSATRHLIFDRDSIFCPVVVDLVKALDTKPRRIAYRRPWQDPVAERWIGSLRRELLDHVVVLSQHHLLQLVKSYIRYYHEDRCHLGLERDTPEGRLVASKPSPHAKVVALPRLGGLHHR